MYCRKLFLLLSFSFFSLNLQARNLTGPSERAEPNSENAVHPSRQREPRARAAVPKPANVQPARARTFKSPTHIEETAEEATSPNLWQRFRFGLGPVLTTGDWIVSPKHNMHLGLMLKKRLQKDMFFVEVGAAGFFSTRSPANTMWSLGIAPGLIAPHIKSGPYIQLPLDYVHVSSTGRGFVDAFRFGAEVGFHLLWIQDKYPLFLQFGYSQVSRRLSGKIPAWYSLTAGIEI